MGEKIIIETIKDRIYTIKGQQVMIDRDLADLYCIENRVLKQAVKRNIKRFPNDFMFVLDENDISFLVSQNVIPSKKHLGGALPYAFTEQGVANLSTILNSDKAIDMNIKIIRAFVVMRKFISSNAQVFQRLDNVERKQLEYDKKFEEVFDAIEEKGIKPDKGIFFDGQIFDAYNFVSNLIRNAKESIILIDNYVDDSILTLLLKRKKGVNVKIYTKNLNKQLRLDLEKHNQQYEKIEIMKLDKAHDRFLIIDEKEIYHLGASLKDLGKKWFAFSKFDKETLVLLNKLKISY